MMLHTSCPCLNPKNLPYYTINPKDYIEKERKKERKKKNEDMKMATKSFLYTLAWIVSRVNIEVRESVYRKVSFL